MKRPITVDELKLLRKKDVGLAFINCISSVFDAYSVYDLIEGKNPDSDKFIDVPKNEARKYCIISLISALEVFCKESIIQYADKWDQNGFNELLKEKIPLIDAINIFKESDVTKEVIVAHSHSFQNIESIAGVFSSLTGTKFFNELEKVRSIDQMDSADQKTLPEDNPDWQTDLSKLFILRHKIIHESNSKIYLSLYDISDGRSLIFDVISAMTKYFNMNSFNKLCKPSGEID